MSSALDTNTRALFRQTCAGLRLLGDALCRWPLWKWLLGPGLTVIVASVMAPLYLTALRPPGDRIVDFFQEWASARNYLEGLPLYANHRVTIPRYLGLEISRPADLTVEVNAHPPTAVLLALPVASLRYQDAVLVWNLISLGMLAVSLTLVWRGFQVPCSLWWLFPLITALLVCTPLILQVFFAQLNLVMLVLLTGTWAANRSNRPRLAGALLGLATTIKLFPVFLFFYFIMRRQWKVFASGALTVVLVTGVTAAVFGFESYRDYYEEVLPRVEGFRANWTNASVVGFWAKLFDPPLNDWQVQPLWRSPVIARLGIAASCAAIVITLALCLRRAASQAQQDRAFGLSLTAMLLVSPIAWDHYLLLLLVPIVATLSSLPRSLAARILFATILIAFWSPPSVIHHFLIPGGKSSGVAHAIHAATILSYQCYALIALFVLNAQAILGQKLLIQRPARGVSSADPMD
jgi:Glycosyltransferase family 87